MLLSYDKNLDSCFFALYFFYNLDYKTKQFMRLLPSLFTPLLVKIDPPPSSRPK